MASLAGRDLLSIADLDAPAIENLLRVAEQAKAGDHLGTPLQGRSIAMIFQRPSNRTRVSFEVAVHMLGGHPIALFNPEVQLGERESAADISRILDRYVDGIVARLVSDSDADDRPWQSLRGKAIWSGDPLAPAVDEKEIEALK